MRASRFQTDRPACCWRSPRLLSVTRAGRRQRALLRCLHWRHAETVLRGGYPDVASTVRLAGRLAARSRCSVPTMVAGRADYPVVVRPAKSAHSMLVHVGGPWPAAARVQSATVPDSAAGPVRKKRLL